MELLDWAPDEQGAMGLALAIAGSPSAGLLNTFSANTWLQTGKEHRIHLPEYNCESPDSE